MEKLQSNEYNQKEISDTQKEISEITKSSLPDNIKKKLIEWILKVEEEAGIKKEKILMSLKDDIKKELSTKLWISVNDVDSKLIKWLQELPKNKEKYLENTTDKVEKNIQEFIKNNHTFFINVKGSYTDINKKKSLENKWQVWPIDTFLGDPQHTIENVPVNYEFQDKVNLTKNIIESSNTLDEFISNLKDSAEFDSLLNNKNNTTEIVAEYLQSLSYIADANLYNSNMFSENFSTQLNTANKALTTNYSPDEYFHILKQSLITNKHINATTCIQLHTFVAKIWEKMNLGEWITSTVDIGVSHRLAILQDKKTWDKYLISDGLLLKGKSYKELISLLGWRFVLQHYLYNSDNKQIGTFQTDTEKQVVQNINWFNQNDTKDFLNLNLDKENLDYDKDYSIEEYEKILKGYNDRTDFPNIN